MTSASDRGRFRTPEPLGVPSLLVAVLAAVGLVVAAVVVVAVSGSAAVRAVAVVLLWLCLTALMVYVYALVTRTGVRPERAEVKVPAGPAMPLGAGIGADRLRSATTTALRDAHALQRGTRHFAEAAASMLRAQNEGAKTSSGLIELFEAQGACAEHQQRLLEQRLEALGQYRSAAADDEAIIAASLYERLLVRGVATNARHAFGLLSLGAATYTLMEHLAAVADDNTTRSLAERCRRELEPLAERWSGSWDTVLDLEAEGANGDAHHAMVALLEETHDMEAMRASLLAVTAAQARAAANAPGAEDAGLGRLVALIDQERYAAEHDRDLLREQLQALDHHPSRRHAFETFAAARATALVEHIRSYKLVRDIRDLVAAGELEAASYELLAGAADRAGDPDTASLARKLHAKERTASERLRAELDSALEIALLAD
jgi:ferritin-like metal-binding protein YciE